MLDIDDSCILHTSKLQRQSKILVNTKFQGFPDKTMIQLSKVRLKLERMPQPDETLPNHQG